MKERQKKNHHATFSIVAEEHFSHFVVLSFFMETCEQQNCAGSLSVYDIF